MAKAIKLKERQTVLNQNSIKHKHCNTDLKTSLSYKKTYWAS